MITPEQYIEMLTITAIELRNQTQDQYRQAELNNILQGIEGISFSLREKMEAIKVLVEELNQVSHRINELQNNTNHAGQHEKHRKTRVN